METIKSNGYPQFRIAASHKFIEYREDETTWKQYTDQNFGYIIYYDDETNNFLVSSKGVFFHDNNSDPAWKPHPENADPFDELLNSEPNGIKDMIESIYFPLTTVAETLEQLEKLPLMRIAEDALKRHDLPLFTFSLLAWLDYRVIESNLDEIIDKKPISCVSPILKEDMTEMERLSATWEFLQDIINLAEVVGESHFDMFSSGKYLAPLLEDFPFLKDIKFSDKEIEVRNKNIRQHLLFKGYDNDLYMKTPIFVKDALNLPKLFEDYQKTKGGWSMVCGNQEIDALLEEAWKSHDIIMLVWWFCIASQIKSDKKHYSEEDIIAGKEGNIQWMYDKLLEWDELDELWFDSKDMPFWSSHCIKELTFLAEDAMYFFGARK